VGTDGIYKTSDFYVASYLLSKGLQIQGIDRHNPRRSEFIFKDREDRPELVQAFVCGRAVGNLPDFISWLNNLRGKGNPGSFRYGYRYVDQ